jgi:hypothetical protein
VRPQSSTSTATFYLPGGGLAWEYARDSWAQLVPSVQPPEGPITAGSARREYQAAAGWVPGRALPGHPAPVQSAATRALLHQVASRVSYGGTAHILFPFRLPKLPASWAVSTVGYVPAGGRLLGTGGLSAGPAVDSGALYVQVQPAGGENTCKIIPGQSYPTRVAGALAEVRTLDEPGKQWQEVCVRDIAGMYLDLSLDGNVPGTSKPLPGQASLGSALSVARRLHLLGTSPAGWTANPVG